MEEKPQIIRETILAIQACVPADWTDERAEAWVNLENPAGTQAGWRMRKESDYQGEQFKDEPPEALHERVPCKDREGFVHIVYDC